MGRPGTSCSKPRDARRSPSADFDVGNAQHHGTPEERRELTGYETGEPAQCNRFVGAA
ncbi:MAG: hypothetical protein M3N04_00705 [Actinomycetota bacterium]|nr:hypothetical protein [Actinomycetota bacterium]